MLLIGEARALCVARDHLPFTEVQVSFALFIIGIVVVIGGVAWGLSVAGVSATYIGIAAVIILGLGITTGVTRTRPKDPS